METSGGTLHCNYDDDLYIQICMLIKYVQIDNNASSGLHIATEVKSKLPGL